MVASIILAHLYAVGSFTVLAFNRLFCCFVAITVAVLKLIWVWVLPPALRLTWLATCSIVLHLWQGICLFSWLAWLATCSIVLQLWQGICFFTWLICVVSTAGVPWIVSRIPWMCSTLCKVGSAGVTMFVHLVWFLCKFHRSCFAFLVIWFATRHRHKVYQYRLWLARNWTRFWLRHATVQCQICRDNYRGFEGVLCCSAHFVCRSCFAGYVRSSVPKLDEGIDFDLFRREGHPDGGIRCPCATEALGSAACSAPPYSEVEVRSALEIFDPEAWERYCKLQIRVADQCAFERDAAPNNDEVLREALLRYLPNARQCKKCGFGPVDHKDCSDLRAHHGQQIGSTHIDNSCPKCHWFTENIRDWPRWDGTIHKAIDAPTHDRRAVLIAAQAEQEQRDRDLAVSVHHLLNGERGFD